MGVQNPKATFVADQGSELYDCGLSEKPRLAVVKKPARPSTRRNATTRCSGSAPPVITSTPAICPGPRAGWMCEEYR